MDSKCLTCTYWKDTGILAPYSGHIGQCRRHAPIAVPTGNGRRASTHYPETFDHDSCGDYKPRDGQDIVDTVRIERKPALPIAPAVMHRAGNRTQEIQLDDPTFETKTPMGFDTTVGEPARNDIVCSESTARILKEMGCEFEGLPAKTLHETAAMIDVPKSHLVGRDKWATDAGDTTKRICDG